MQFTYHIIHQCEMYNSFIFTSYLSINKCNGHGSYIQHSVYTLNIISVCVCVCVCVYSQN